MEIADGSFAQPAPPRRMTRRWCVFNAVGVMGATLQLLVLTVLIRLLGIDGPVATALAVEAAILHNFLWHERWTWGERDAGTGGRWLRLARFNLVAGALSITTNVVLTAAYAEAFEIDYVLANLLAIGSCSTLTFLASDRLVFRPSAGAVGRDAKRRSPAAGDGDEMPPSRAARAPESAHPPRTQGLRTCTLRRCE